MVTSYYITKLTKNKRPIDVDEYFNHNIQNAEGLFEKKNSKCRICLRDGSLPIHDSENTLEIIHALKIFTSIDIKQDDIFPKKLCNICYQFVRNAIMFRKIAIQSDQLLQKHFKLQENKCLDDNLVVLTHSSSSSKKRNNTSFQQFYDKNIISDMKIQCPTCKRIIRKSYYKIHMTMHDPDHEKYVCDICGKTFRLRVGYHNHRLRHRTDYPFKCNLCPFKGRYAERLKSHMKTHTREYRYMCTECPARFLFKGNLNSHVLLKHKEPQHKCNNCDKAFHTKLKLQRHHEVEHLGMKSHVCNICGRTFGYRNAMMKHQRRVHKREKLRFSYNSSQDHNKNV